MAHECPECYQQCYCDGHDLFMDDDATLIACKHYLVCQVDEVCEEE